jgi:hypothetical protein
MKHEDMKKYYQNYDLPFDVDHSSSSTESNISDAREQHEELKENFPNHEFDDLTLTTESQSSNDGFAILIQKHCMPDSRAPGMASLR